MTSPLEWMLRRFRERAGAPFIVAAERPFTYGWLADAVARWEERLAGEGIAPGAAVSLEADYSPEAVAALLALIDRRAAIVPLTDSVAVHRDEFLEIARVEHRVLLGAGGPRVLHPGRPAGEPAHALIAALRERAEPGLVLFSSGSTGKSKAALHSFTALLEKFRRPRHAFVTLTFLLLDHIGGINTLLYVLSNLGTVVALRGRDPDEVCAAIARHRVELLPTSPTFLNLLLVSEAYRRHDLSSLKRITYGTEVMPQSTLTRIRELLPAVELQQTYGLSEVGILRSRSRSSDSLWVKLGGEGFETRVQDGTLWVRARSAMLGYLNAPSPFDAEGWLNTGDAVEVDGEYVRILGRASELINVGGMKVYPAEVESVLLSMPNVKDAAVTGEKNALTGAVVVARLNLFQPEELPALRRRMREFCRGRLQSYKIPARIEIVDQAQHSQRFKKMRQVREEG